jgi:hypothetical protein
VDVEHADILAGMGVQKADEQKCQPLPMVTLIMSKLSLVGAEKGFRSKWRAVYSSVRR